MQAAELGHIMNAVLIFARGLQRYLDVTCTSARTRWPHPECTAPSRIELAQLTRILRNTSIDGILVPRCLLHSAFKRSAVICCRAILEPDVRVRRWHRWAGVVLAGNVRAQLVARLWDVQRYEHPFCKRS